MQFRTRECVVAIGVVLCGLCAPALAQLPPPPPPPTTLWSFLGIPQAYRSIRDSRSNRSGNRPQAERKPPLKAIADPKNLESGDPAIKKAAEVKQAEDLAPQKIKAVKYLASIGCGCYNRDGSITDALLKSMDDCTEEVRLMTVRAIAEAAAREQCANCKQRSCCSEEISNKLYEIAYEKDENGCFLEPSERVRLSAAEALRTCCPGGDEDFFMAPAPTPATGGERPSVAPPSGGERPGNAPPIPVPQPVPVPAIPLQNPPLPPAPAPAAAIPIQRVPTASSADRALSNRRTALAQPTSPQLVVPQAVVPPPVTQQTATKQTATKTIVAKATPLRREDRPAAAPDGSAVTKSVQFVPPARGPLPLESPKFSDAVSASPAVRVGTEAEPPSFVTTAGLTRLPPVDSPTGNAVPAPPLPSAGTSAIPISSRRTHTQSAKKIDASATTTTVPLESKHAPIKQPVSQRTLPGAQFGTGMVTSVRLKDGVALIEFGADAAVPTGSVVRAYHEYALTGKTAVCDLEVIRGEGGLAAAVARQGSELTALSVGDDAIVLR